MKKNRKARRAQVALAKRKAHEEKRADDANAEQFVTQRQLQQVVEAYEQNLASITEVLTHNARAVRDALALVDAHMHVTRRVMNDVVQECFATFNDPNFTGELPVWGDSYFVVGTEEGEVDYEWYFEQYNFCTAMIHAGLAIRRFLELDTPSEEVPEDPYVDEIEFGGDYVPHQNERTRQADSGL